MKTSYIRQVYTGAVGDTKNLEIHFAEMAMQGWMIEKIGALVHRYRAIEPSKKRFIVDFLPQITAFDYPENEDAQDYRRICEESGWTFVTANKQLHVFYSDEGTAEPVPIHTDNKIQAQIHLSMCRKYELFNLISPMFIFGLLVFPNILYSGMELFLSNIQTSILFGSTLFLGGYFWHVGFVISWYQQTKKSAKLDLPLPTINYRLARIRQRVFSIGALAFVVCLITGVSLDILGGMPIGFLLIVVIPLVGLGVGFWVKNQIDTKRRGRKANIALTIIAIGITQVIVLSAVMFGILQSIPNRDMSAGIGNRPALTLYSVGIYQEPEHTSSFIRGSIAVPIHYSHWEMNRQGDVSTEIYRPIHSLITRGLFNRFTRKAVEGRNLAELRGIDGEIRFLTDEEARFWGVDEGVIAVNFDIESPEPILHSGSTIELILMNGNTILRLSVFGEGVEIESIAQAVRSLTSD